MTQKEPHSFRHWGRAMAAVPFLGHFSLILFVLAGFTAVLLSYKRNPLSFRESAAMSLKTGLVVVAALFVFSAFLGTGSVLAVDAEIPGSGFLMFSVYAFLQVLSMCLLSLIGGMTAHLWESKMKGRLTP